MKNGNPVARQTIFVAYVMLPIDIDREKYIDYCKKKKVVCLINEDGEFFRNSRLAKGLIRSINFPSDTKTFGSPVLCVTETFHQTPIVANVLEFGDEPTIDIDSDFYLFKNLDKSSLGVSASLKNKTATISISAEEVFSVFVNLLSSGTKIESNILVQGFLSILTHKNIDLASYKEVFFKIVDSKSKELCFISMNDSAITVSFTGGGKIVIDKSSLSVFHQKKLIFQEGNEAYVLLSKLTSILDQIITTSTTFTGVDVVTQAAVAPNPGWVASMQALKSNFAQLGSTSIFGK